MDKVALICALSLSESVVFAIMVKQHQTNTNGILHIFLCSYHIAIAFGYDISYK